MNCLVSNPNHLVIKSRLPKISKQIRLQNLIYANTLKICSSNNTLTKGDEDDRFVTKCIRNSKNAIFGDKEQIQSKVIVQVLYLLGELGNPWKWTIEIITRAYAGEQEVMDHFLRCDRRLATGDSYTRIPQSSGQTEDSRPRTLSVRTRVSMACAKDVSEKAKTNTQGGGKMIILFLIACFTEPTEEQIELR